jgi:hypothetical protein
MTTQSGLGVSNRVMRDRYYDPNVEDLRRITDATRASLNRPHPERSDPQGREGEDAK